MSKSTQIGQLLIDVAAGTKDPTTQQIIVLNEWLDAATKINLISEPLAAQICFAAKKDSVHQKFKIT